MEQEYEIMKYRRSSGTSLRGFMTYGFNDYS
jgi:hypothetical protein